MALDTVEKAILSTDLALYLKRVSRMRELVDTGEKLWYIPEKRELLHAMLMTACDVSAMCKPWDVQYRVVNLISSEFFEQVC